MKLYYSPGACSLASHIVLREAGQAFDLVKVDLAAKTTETCEDFKQINPLGCVPALQLDSGEVLTEGVAIMQYVADQTPDAELAPANGTFDRSRLQARLNFIATELHKSFTPLFTGAGDDEKQRSMAKIEFRLDYVNEQLADRRYLLGEKFSVADVYLFVVTSWAGHVDISLDKWPNVAAYAQRLAKRDAVQAALQAEGLMK